MRFGKPILLTLSASWLATVALIPAPPQQKQAAAKIDFSNDILPILSDKCFKCHGPDASGRMANLRLDIPEGAFADRGGKWPIVPGKPEDSLVVKRITAHEMPPKFSGKTLSQQEIDTIAEWIKQGARYGKLWSFEPLPKAVPVPQVKSSWPRNDIDRFILARLQKEGLKPSKPASRDRWLRRVTFDLTGLPPTVEEIVDFEHDKSPAAFEKVVDRLLASPHFGERVAVDWLDAARYADSYGYQSDLIMPVWPYRDWVVKAFNQNLPYDKFLTDQLAGDLLKNPTRDQVLATAFNRLHRQSNEGGSIPLEFKTEYAVDRVSTFGTAMLGLTLGCARCHDHKFDPISQKEFYQLYGYFNSINEFGLLLSTEIVPTPSLLLPTPAQDKTLRELRANNAAALALVSKAEDGEGRFKAWLAGHPAKPEIPGLLARISLARVDKGRYPDELGGKPYAEKMGDVESVPGRNGGAVLLDGDNGIVVRGLPAKERWEPFTWSFWVSDARPSAAPMVLLHRTGGTDVGFCGFDLILEDGYLTARVMRTWPGNAVAVRTAERFPKDAWTQVAWSWDGSGRAVGLKLYLNGKPAETTVLNDSLWKKINAYGDLGPSGGDWAFGQRFRDAGFKGGRLQDLAFAGRVLSPIEIAQLYDGSSLAAALQSPPAHTQELKDYYFAAFDDQAARARAEVRKAQTALTNAEEGVYEVPVMRESPKLEPAYLLARGRYDAPRTEATRVNRDVPHVLPPLKLHGPNDRLALARWLTDPNHPLTARVAVNRFWQMIFGVGLVETTENFGIQGSRPTHPELLDYLARRFVNSGWNVKALLREMVLSATYRQDSARTEKLNRVDPDNRLYARGPSGRLSAEMIRDAFLASSGLLNDKIGGAPVNPYQPAGIWQENNTMSPPFVQSKGADLYRRSLYTTWKRTTPMPSMMMFDATSREACTVRRQATDTPMQALVLLNDVQFVEAARALAELVLKSPGSDRDRIALAFERAAGRPPDSTEAAILQETLKEQRTQFDPGSAKKLLGIGDSKTGYGNVVELAAMTVTMQEILNSDAVIWKR